MTNCFKKLLCNFTCVTFLLFYQGVNASNNNDCKFMKEYEDFIDNDNDCNFIKEYEDIIDYDINFNPIDNNISDNEIKKVSIEEIKRQYELKLKKIYRIFYCRWKKYNLTIEFIKGNASVMPKSILPGNNTLFKVPSNKNLCKWEQSNSRFSKPVNDSDNMPVCIEVITDDGSIFDNNIQYIIVTYLEFRKMKLYNFTKKLVFDDKVSLDKDYVFCISKDIFDKLPCTNNGFKQDTHTEYKVQIIQKIYRLGVKKQTSIDYYIKLLSIIVNNIVELNKKLVSNYNKKDLNRNEALEELNLNKTLMDNYNKEDLTGKEILEKLNQNKILIDDFNKDDKYSTPDKLKEIFILLMQKILFSKLNIINDNSTKEIIYQFRTDVKELIDKIDQDEKLIQKFDEFKDNINKSKNLTSKANKIEDNINKNKDLTSKSNKIEDNFNKNKDSTLKFNGIKDDI